MTRDEIENVVSDILISDGPDGHCDGADVITSFIVAIMDGNAEAWAATYGRGGRVAVESIAPSNA